jgi:DNA mismatch endonuclease (patch repair protein)
MTDIISQVQRSNLMSRIRGKNTTPELVVRKLLHSMGYRFRLHASNLPGCPDIVLPKYRTIVFVHGCFWHRHSCGAAYMPKTRTSFWEAKFIANVDRDKRHRRALTADGWKVVVVWECQTPARAQPLLLRRLKEALRHVGAPNQR